MTILPKILQVLFFRSNRLYTPVIHHQKLYGVFLAGQFHDRETVTFVADFIVFLLVFFPILISSVPVLSWLLSQVGLTLNPDIVIFIDFILWLGSFYLYRLYRSSSTYQKIATKFYNFLDLKFKISPKASIREKLALEQIEQASDLEFLSSNSKNFIIDLAAIKKIKISAKNSWLIWPESHFGQLKLVLKPESKSKRTKLFVLKEDRYHEIVAALDHVQIKLEQI